MTRALLPAVAILLAGPAAADSNLPPARLANAQLPDPAQEAQARALMDTIRCLVCQSESIADSNADLAGDMRALIRARIAAGEKPAAIRAWLVRRYGAWVSFSPPLGRLTWPLWVAPVLFVGIGLFLARGSVARRRRR